MLKVDVLEKIEEKLVAVLVKTYRGEMANEESCKPNFGEQIICLLLCFTLLYLCLS